MTENEEAILREKLIDEEVGKPLQYVKHDTNAHEDEKILALVDEGGLAWYGLYWLMVESIAGRKGHVYDIDNANEHHRLHANLNKLTPVDGGEIDRFIEFCASVGLIDQLAFKEYGKVAIPRIIDNGRAAAYSKAARRLGGIKAKRGKDS